MFVDERRLGGVASMRFCSLPQLFLQLLSPLALRFSVSQPSADLLPFNAVRVLEAAVFGAEGVKPGVGGLSERHGISSVGVCDGDGSGGVSALGDEKGEYWINAGYEGGDIGSNSYYSVLSKSLRSARMDPRIKPSKSISAFGVGGNTSSVFHGEHEVPEHV